MGRTRKYNKKWNLPSFIRRIITAWLFAVTVEYCFLPPAVQNLQELDGIAGMSGIRVLLFAVVIFLLLTFLNTGKLERWLMVGIYAVLSAVSVYITYSLPFLIANGSILIILIFYAVYGWNDAPAVRQEPSCENKIWYIIVAISALAFIVFVSIWTVCRVYTFSTPTYDFGIFSQMFYNMKTTGLPMTTLERDGLLSHFHVHVSPVYYLLLPFYYLFPYPATLQVLQAIILSTAVIPLWLIGKQHNLHPSLRALVCVVLLLYPAYSGGTSYDIHENAFLTPLLFWLFYGFDKKSIPTVLISALLVLTVKEDAAVYAAIAALYYLLHGVLQKSHFECAWGLIVTVLAVIWFVLVTGYLSEVGDGVMTYRYNNFMYDGGESLLTVVKSVFLCPLKAVFECVDVEKLKFIGYTMLPLAALPLFTRRYERYLLLIPYVLVNLMPDYQYQHSIFFQYTYGSTACLFYMVAINLADFKQDFKKFVAMAAALCISCACFISQVIPKAIPYAKRYIQNADTYAEIEDTLSQLPDDAAVSATTFYTTYLSQRHILYDIRYASDSNILSTEYAVIATNDDDFKEVCVLLENNGYSVYDELEDTLIIYQIVQ